MSAQFGVTLVVLQPTTLCNLNCRYCYLPSRALNRQMQPEVTERLASSLSELPDPVRIVWHGGEPLSCGLGHFAELCSPLLGHPMVLEQCVQTNATLLDDHWAEFFKANQFRVGVSVDPPAEHDSQRVDWSGRGSLSRVVRGIEALRRAGLTFSVIAVVGRDGLGSAQALYDFVQGLGAKTMGVNIEEVEGLNTRQAPDDERVTEFWQALFEAWRANPVMRIREFTAMLELFKAIEEDVPVATRFRAVELIPTIGVNGDVVVLSPELLGADAPDYGNFVVGNVYSDPLGAVLVRARESAYVSDYLRGVAACSDSCEYFGLCAGGQAANKYYELGRLEGTETNFCRNTKKRLAEAILRSVGYA